MFFKEFRFIIFSSNESNHAVQMASYKVFCTKAWELWSNHFKREIHVKFAVSKMSEFIFLIYF